jgi:apolipoprotein N-acyltransferase
MDKINKYSIFLSILSGLLLTGSFPNIHISGLAWFALVPLLISIRNRTIKESFRLGLITGLVHYLTLVYWLAYTMQTYGHLPLYLSIPVLVLMSTILALFVAVFSALINRLSPRPFVCFIMIPVLWVSLEYFRSFLFTGFPWELVGYSQYTTLHIIQISDIFGVYGVSFLILLTNATIYSGILYLTGGDEQRATITRRLVIGTTLCTAIIFGIVWFYGAWRIKTIDDLSMNSPSARMAIVQGNIEQTLKWDPGFQIETIKKYIKLSHLVKAQKPDLIVWPESATPFYFLHNRQLSAMILKGIKGTDTNFLIGSPSFVQKNKTIKYYNSAYLVSPEGRAYDKYDKAHLVPYGEYVPLRKWLPFLGKMVPQVGDFEPGDKGKTMTWNNHKLGVLICYEIIFPELARVMAKNGAELLINITNDAWYGRTSAPYQHFSMAILRAVENRRALIRSANTGISGFIDPVGRIMAKTQLFQDAALTHEMPILNTTVFYSRHGDLLAMTCLAVMLLVVLHEAVRLIFKSGKQIK